ncbi:MAG: PIG-L family deacetylase, partial [Actinomycetota bacterium]
MSGGLLGVFAHPDDETYSMAGCMARYTDEGIPTAILCFTRGEAGMIADGSGATRENLGEV